MAWSIDSSQANTRNDTPSNPFTVSYTVGSGSNRFLVVTISNFTNNQTVTAVTYNGTSMTQLPTNSPQTTYGGGTQNSFFYLVNPSSGSNTLSITWSASTSQFYYAAVSYTGVEQTPTIRSSSAQSGSIRTSSSVSLTGTSANDLMVISQSGEGDSVVPGTGVTLRSYPGSIYSHATGDKNATGSSDSLSVTTSSNWWTTIGAAFAPATASTVNSNFFMFM